MISVQLHLDDLQERIDTATRLVNETDPPGGTASPISREARGLAIVLLFAAYENLLTSLTRTLLEGAKKTRASNRRLQPGFRAFALRPAVESVRDTSDRKLYVSALPNLVELASRGGHGSTIDVEGFPADGSFMKRTQIVLWCNTFGVPHPQALLSRTWTVIDTIVAQRNEIAHGAATPESVGRGYTKADLLSLIADWHDDWSDFTTKVGVLGQSRDFFRTP